MRGDHGGTLVNWPDPEDSRTGRTVTANIMTACYACNEPSTSSEHVPPRVLFPELKDAQGDRGLRRDLITVPSCDAHNSEKSKDDEYLLWVLSANARANSLGVQQAMTKLIRSYQRRPAPPRPSGSQSSD